MLDPLFALVLIKKKQTCRNTGRKTGFPTMRSAFELLSIYSSQKFCQDPVDRSHSLIYSIAQWSHSVLESLLAKMR